MPLIADTTVWSKLRRAPGDVQADFRAAAHEGLIVSSPVVRLEWLHDAENPTEFDERDGVFSGLPELMITPAICRVAVDALPNLRASGSHGHHRVMAGDALVAATAESNRVNVLHDDRHYITLATVLPHFQAVRFGPYA